MQPALTQKRRQGELVAVNDWHRHGRLCKSHSPYPFSPTQTTCRIMTQRKYSLCPSSVFYAHGHFGLRHGNLRFFNNVDIYRGNF
jgi:hypothetical protein